MIEEVFQICAVYELLFSTKCITHSGLSIHSLLTKVTVAKILMHCNVWIVWFDFNPRILDLGLKLTTCFHPIHILL